MHAVDFWRWQYFKPVEVLSAAGLREYKNGNLLIQPFALDMLNNFRRSLGVPVICNTKDHTRRGYRSAAENADCGGAQFTRHVQGIAFDIVVPTLSLQQVKDAAIRFGWGGIGVYLSAGFVHLDARAILNGAPVIFQR
jgi:uncharacterized protein YcbK (DUF882 family)